MLPQSRAKTGCFSATVLLISVFAIAGACFAFEPLIKNNIIPTPATQPSTPTQPDPLPKEPAAGEQRYILIVGADWCSACTSMHADIARLRKEGYAVYYEDYRSETVSKLGIVHCPLPAIAVIGKTAKGAVRLSLKIGAMPFKALSDHVRFWRIARHVEILKPF